MTRSYRKERDIQCVGIVATGYVGAGWTAFFLSRGLRVRVFARRPEAEGELRQAIETMWPDLETGLHPNADRSAWSFTTDLESAVQGCDFVQENAAENAELKAELYQRIDAATPADVLIASSTSSLPITEIQRACRFPERCVLGHPFTPTHLMRLVEVVGGRSTDAAAVDAAMDSYRHWGKRPVRLNREIFGHIGNRLASALWREAVNLVAEGVASVKDVDTAVVEGLGRKWAIAGPFQSYHLSGGKGGFERFITSYGPGIQKRWDDLGQPRLDGELRSRLAELVQTAMRDQPVEELEQKRAALLARLSQLLDQQP